MRSFLATILVCLPLAACVDDLPDSALPGELDDEQLAETEQALVFDLPSFGGWGGQYFYDPVGCPVTSITVYRGRFIDGLTTVYRCPDRNVKIHRGGFGGTASTFHLFAGEDLVGISGRAGSYVDSIQFHTSWNRISPPYGGTGGTWFSSSVPPGYRFAGWHGRAGNYIDRLGMIANQP